MASITYLPVDIVIMIISFVVKAPDGARDLTRIMLSCKLFLEVSNSVAVQKVVNFDYAQMFRGVHSFPDTNGLLYKCVKASNPSAECLLAQIILTTSSQLVDLKMSKERLNIFQNYRHRSRGEARREGVLASFITRFIPAPGINPICSQESDPRPLLYHWEFVRVFILKGTLTDIIRMRSQLWRYTMLFSASQFNSRDVKMFLQLINSLLSVCRTEDDMLFWRVMFEDSMSPRFRDVKIQTRTLFEEVRVCMLREFDNIIPKLC